MALLKILPWIYFFLTVISEGTKHTLRSDYGDFRVHNIYGDGNCMFRAVSFVVWGTEDHHEYLRDLVVHHVQNTWDKIKPFVMAEWNMTTLNQYVAYMGKEGTFASELECVLATKLNRMSLAIYKKTEKRWIQRIFYNEYNNQVQTAHLLFSGATDSGHYDVLTPV